MTKRICCLSIRLRTSPLSVRFSIIWAGVSGRRPTFPRGAARHARSDLVGAPFVDDAALWEEMRDLRLPGVIFRRCFFTPQFNKHAGQICRGLQLHVTDVTPIAPS